MKDFKKALVARLGSTVCLCGEDKERGKAYCLECFRSLGKSQQRALYKRMGEGFEEAFQDAMETLIMIRRIMDRYKMPEQIGLDNGVKTVPDNGVKTVPKTGYDPDAEIQLDLEDVELEEESSKNNLPGDETWE